MRNIGTATNRVDRALKKYVFTIEEACERNHRVAYRKQIHRSR